MAAHQLADELDREGHHLQRQQASNPPLLNEQPNADEEQPLAPTSNEASAIVGRVRRKQHACNAINLWRGLSLVLACAVIALSVLLITSNISNVENDQCSIDQDCADVNASHSTMKCVLSEARRDARKVCCPKTTKGLVEGDEWSDVCTGLLDGTYCHEQDSYCQSSICLLSVCVPYRLPDGQTCHKSTDCDGGMCGFRSLDVSAEARVCCGSTHEGVCLRMTPLGGSCATCDTQTTATITSVAGGIGRRRRTRFPQRFVALVGADLEIYAPCSPLVAAVTIMMFARVVHARSRKAASRGTWRSANPAMKVNNVKAGRAVRRGFASLRIWKLV